MSDAISYGLIAALTGLTVATVADATMNPGNTYSSIENAALARLSTEFGKPGAPAIGEEITYRGRGTYGSLIGAQRTGEFGTIKGERGVYVHTQDGLMLGGVDAAKPCINITAGSMSIIGRNGPWETGAIVSGAGDDYGDGSIDQVCVSNPAAVQEIENLSLMADRSQLQKIINTERLRLSQRTAAAG